MPGRPFRVPARVEWRLLPFPVCLRRKFVLCDNVRADNSMWTAGALCLRSLRRR